MNEFENLNDAEIEELHTWLDDLDKPLEIDRFQATPTQDFALVVECKDGITPEKLFETYKRAYEGLAPDAMENPEIRGNQLIMKFEDEGSRDILMRVANEFGLDCTHHRRMPQ